MKDLGLRWWQRLILYSIVLFFVIIAVGCFLVVFLPMLISR